jgi:hypothetical protein
MQSSSSSSQSSTLQAWCDAHTLDGGVTTAGAVGVLVVGVGVVGVDDIFVSDKQVDGLLCFMRRYFLFL